jgi:hypothetical protein
MLLECKTAFLPRSTYVEVELLRCFVIEFLLACRNAFLIITYAYEGFGAKRIYFKIYVLFIKTLSSLKLLYGCRYNLGLEVDIYS